MTQETLPAVVALEALPAIREALALTAPDRRPVDVYLQRLPSPRSKRTMRQALDRMAGLLTSGALNADTLPWWQLRAQHAIALCSMLVEHGFAVRSQGKMRAALRGVLRACWKLELVDAETLGRTLDDWPKAKNVAGPDADGDGQPKRKGRALSEGELLALFQVCGPRDAAMLAALVGCGLRRSEAVALNLGDYSSVNAEDASQGVLRVLRGKGGKCREVPVTNGTKAALDAWLDVRGPEPGPLFLPVDRVGRIHMRRMSTQSVYEALHRRARAAGVDTFAPHDLRRTFISDLLDASADVSAIQDLAGHANPATTVGYDRRGARAARKAANLVRIPYVPRKGA